MACRISGLFDLKAPKGGGLGFIGFWVRVWGFRTSFRPAGGGGFRVLALRFHRVYGYKGAGVKTLMLCEHLPAIPLDGDGDGDDDDAGIDDDEDHDDDDESVIRATQDMLAVAFPDKVSHCVAAFSSLTSVF